MPENLEHTAPFRIRNALLTITRCWPHMLPTVKATSAGTIGRRGDPRRLLVHEHIMETRRRTLLNLSGWALVVAEERDLRPTEPCVRPVRVIAVKRNRWVYETICGCRKALGRRTEPRHRLDASDAVALGMFLKRHADWLADHEAAEDALTELEESARYCQRIAEPMQAVKFAGVCDVCGDDLMGNGKTARCQGCEAVVDGATQQERVRAAVADRLMTKRELLDLSPLVGKRLHSFQFDRWVKAGKIAQHTTNTEGLPMYPVSDFLGLLVPEQQQEAS